MTIEEGFVRFADGSAMLVELIAVVIVTFGALEGAARIARLVVHPGASHGERKAVWRRLGVWLLIGLEFELAADIIRTAISPSWMQIGELGAIAVIRTFLNYFLERDLQEAEESAAAPLPS